MFKRNKVSNITNVGIFSLYLAAFIGGLASTIYLPAVLTMEHDLGTVSSYIKLLLPCYLLGVSGGSLIIGTLADVYKTKKVYLICFFIYILSSLVCMIATDVYVLLFVRVIQGAGAVAGATLSLSMVTKYLTGEKFDKIVFTLVALISLGPALASSLGGILLIFIDSWRFIFLLLTALIVLNTVLLY